MTLEQFTQGLAEHAAKVPPFGKSIQFQFPEGSVTIDGSGETTRVHNDPVEADTTIISKLEHVDRMRRGDLNPMTAMMTGKLKIKGDMGLAMRLKDLM
jgi:putative sterol carrier protein